MKLDFAHSNHIEIPSLNAADVKQIKNKGWSFSYVYDFSEIRDTFLVLKEYPFKGLKDFADYCKKINLPYAKTEWTERRILENLNALKNFDLIDNEYVPSKEVFKNSEIGTSITILELDVFRTIYFSYFRFKEIFSWFINPNMPDRYSYILSLSEENIIKESKPIYTFSNKGKFTDSFTMSLTSLADIYYIDPDKQPELIRFWDVFIKWGVTLQVLEKFSLKQLDIVTTDNKSIACTYVINSFPINFELLPFIKKTFPSEFYIYVPKLVLNLIQHYRVTVDLAHQIIIKFYKEFKEMISFERTSEIFIKKGNIREFDKILFPKYNDSYISHLIIRQ
jgi:hypothetical protein